MGYSPRGVCNQGLVAFLVVTPSRAGCKLTAIFPVTGFGGFRALANQLAGHICGVPLPFVPRLLWFLITIQTWIMEGGGVFSSPSCSNLRAFHKTGFAKILSFSVISFNLPGFRCVRVCVKYQLIRLLATRLVYQLRFVTVTRCFSNFLHYVC